MLFAVFLTLFGYSCRTVLLSDTISLPGLNAATIVIQPEKSDIYASGTAQSSEKNHNPNKWFSVSQVMVQGENRDSIYYVIPNSTMPPNGMGPNYYAYEIFIGKPKSKNGYSNFSQGPALLVISSDDLKLKPDTIPITLNKRPETLVNKVNIDLIWSKKVGPIPIGTRVEKEREICSDRDWAALRLLIGVPGLINLSAYNIPHPKDWSDKNHCPNLLESETKLNSNELLGFFDFHCVDSPDTIGCGVISEKILNLFQAKSNIKLEMPKYSVKSDWWSIKGNEYKFPNLLKTALAKGSRQ
jgi:hypothetical protein